MNYNLRHKFCSSYYRDAAVRLVIRDNKLFFLRKSKALRGRNLVGASSDESDKRTVLKPDSDGGYDLSILPHANQVLSLCSHIPDTDYYSSYIRVPISVSVHDVGFHNTPAFIYNVDKLKRIPTDKGHLQNWLKATDYFQSDEEPIKNLAEDIARRCVEDNYLRVLEVHKFVTHNIFYDNDELQAKERQDDSSVAVFRRRHTTCRGYVSLCVSLLIFILLELRDGPLESFRAARDDRLVHAAREAHVAGHAEAAPGHDEDPFVLQGVHEREVVAARRLREEVERALRHHEVDARVGQHLRHQLAAAVVDLEVDRLVEERGREALAEHRRVDVAERAVRERDGVDERVAVRHRGPDRQVADALAGERERL